MTQHDFIYRLSPYVRVAFDHRVEKMVLPPRIIFDYELLYLAKGKLLVQIEDQEYLVLPGNMLLFRPGKKHGFTTLDGEEAWMPHIHFDVLYYDDFKNVPVNFKPLDQCSEEELQLIRPDVLNADGLNIPDVIIIHNHKEVLKYMMSLIHTFEKRQPDSILIQKSLVLNILHLIKEGLSMQEDPLLLKHQNSLEQAAEYLISHYAEEISLATLAKICCVSIYHFEKLFKKKYHISPIAYQLRYRMEHAKMMMSYSQMTISSIAELTGYGSIHSFSKAFKKVEGISPAAFARLQQKKQF